MAKGTAKVTTAIRPGLGENTESWCELDLAKSERPFTGKAVMLSFVPGERWAGGKVQLRGRVLASHAHGPGFGPQDLGRKRNGPPTYYPSRALGVITQLQTYSSKKKNEFYTINESQQI